MNNDPNHPNERGLTRLCPADAGLMDRLIAGEPIDSLLDPNEPGRDERVRRLLGLLARWDAADPSHGLADRAAAGVLVADPVSLSPEDGAALDALLELRRRGLTAGPMPAGSRARTERIGEVLSLLDQAVDEPVPGGLAAETMRAIEQEREEEKRLLLASASSGPARPSGISIRQVATTAAMLLMVLSVLLPMLDKGKRDAMIAQCGANLAGLGIDLQRVAEDNKGSVEADPPDPAIFNHLSAFARSEVDGSVVPASQISLFVLRDQRRVESEHLRCPAADADAPTAFYNGQNPVAGGPLRIFLKHRPIFADTNPLYRVTKAGLVRNVEVPGMTKSRNHDGVGQNVLISDGSVRWMVRPAFSGGDDEPDNIWLLQKPDPNDSEPDVFLTP